MALAGRRAVTTTLERSDEPAARERVAAYPVCLEDIKALLVAMLSVAGSFALAWPLVTRTSFEGHPVTTPC
jgi:hypothetical protein